MKPMYAVVSLLDQGHYRQVEDLWDELRRHCGVEGVYQTPFPHFSYHVAHGYNLVTLQASLQRFARNTPPFRVRTAGLGIFTGQHPVVYIPVVRSPELTALHEALWPEADATATRSIDHYHPDLWVPHITVGQGDLCHENLGDVVQLLNQRSLNWNVTVDNLAVISSSGSAEGLHFKVQLGA
ncbi:MAG TPA: 2'-5' RNA ligase family protein [Symbiobacteriaceae bacterium]|nr:2'-5' RNA ligase family protein [Symbiobacteriaceae bacterium]